MADGGLRNRQKQLVVSSGGGVLAPPYIESTDIIVEILSWLPGNTLLRFRRVCKLWRTTISDSNFVRKQLCRRTNDNNFRLMLFKGGPLQSIDYESLSSLFVRSEDISSTVDASCSSRTHNLQRSSQSQIRRVNIVGSCNGLVCLVINCVDIFIWNPCTGLTNVLPFGPCFYGFGYDSVTDDYKVILGENSNASRTGKVVVFTLKRGSWRKVEGLNQDDGIQLQKRGLLLNGALHWLHRGLISTESRIVSFNLAEERFRELVPLSNIVNGRRNMRADIGPYRRSHLFCYLRGDDENMEIWVMMEYGVKESWTRLMLVQMDDHQRRPNYIYVLDDDKVLMSCLRGDFILYDPKGQKTYWITLKSRKSPVESAMYTETLVSPVAGK